MLRDVVRRLGRALLVPAVLAALVGGAVSPASARPSCHPPAAVTIDGDVANPGSYTPAALAALPQTTVVGRHGRPVSGVSLDGLVTAAAPVLPAGKNTQLRVVIRVTGAGGRTVAVALGELDPGFGDHPALLVHARHGTELVVPQDATPLRTVVGVRHVEVRVSTAQAVVAPAGGLVVQRAGRSVTLTAAQLARLPADTRQVTFRAGTATQTHTESGPRLLTVLLAAHVLPRSGTSVTAVGSDSYAAAVTPAEDYLGGRPLLISLVEDGTPLSAPRLVADGDVKGGRYVSGLVSLVVDTVTHRRSSTHAFR